MMVGDIVTIRPRALTNLLRSYRVPEDAAFLKGQHKIVSLQGEGRFLMATLAGSTNPNVNRIFRAPWNLYLRGNIHCVEKRPREPCHCLWEHCPERAKRGDDLCSRPEI